MQKLIFNARNLKNQEYFFVPLINIKNRGYFFQSSIEPSAKISLAFGKCKSTIWSKVRLENGKISFKSELLRVRRHSL